MIKPGTPAAKRLSELKWERAKPRKGRLYRQFIELIRASDLTMQDLSRTSGITIQCLKEWGLRTDARLGNFEAALNTLGYQLSITPKVTDNGN